MKILITGGSGFLGCAVVKKLKKHDVRIFCRHKTSKGCCIAGDITKYEELEKAFPVDVVIHLAAVLDDDDPALYCTNVRGTQNIIDLCKKYHVKQLIFMSSVGALGHTTFAVEDARKNPKTRYERSKSDAEELIMQSGIPYTIVRAPVILGPSRTWLDVIHAAQKKYPMIGNGANRFHLAYVDDVGALIAKSMGNKKAYCHIFHVAMRDIPTYREFYTMLCDALHIPMTEKTIAPTVVRGFSLVHTVVSRVRGKHPSSTLKQSNIDRLTRDRVVSIEKAKQTLGFTPRYTTKMAIAATVNHFKKLGML